MLCFCQRREVENMSTINSENIQNGASTSQYADNYSQSKMKWEEEFWKQQRNFAADDSSESKNNGAAMANITADQQEASFEANKLLNPQGRVITNMVQSPVSQSTANGLKNTTLSVLHSKNQEGQNAGAGYKFANTIRSQKSELIMHTTNGNSYTRSSESLKQSMIVANEQSVSVWLGRGKDKDKLGLVNEMKEALSWFGLKLKSLVVSGKSIFSSSDQESGQNNRGGK